MQEVRDNGLSVDYIPNFIPIDKTFDLFKILFETIEWPYPFYNKDGTPSKKRNVIVFGREYRSIKVFKEWPPIMESIRATIEEKVQHPINTCIVQIYGTGKTKIRPHQDKEVPPYTKIIGLSLGAERIIKFERKGYEDHDILLENGSLYLMNPPTNTKWAHSIPECETDQPRMSLTFRYIVYEDN